MPQSPDFQYDVFLSRNAKDKPPVRRLVPSAQPSTINSQPARTAVHRDPSNAGRRFIPLLPGDCALPDTLRRCKVVDFREESEAAFAEVPATLRDTLLPKLLSGELSVNETAAKSPTNTP